jgi:hypothetical protein
MSSLTTRDRIELSILDVLSKRGITRGPTRCAWNTARDV